MIRRTGEEEEPKKTRMYISVLNDVVEMVNKIVVNKYDRKKLVEELWELDDKAERSVKKGLTELGVDFVYG